MLAHATCVCRCNVQAQQRADFLELARSVNVPAHCVVLALSRKVLCVFCICISFTSLFLLLILMTAGWGDGEGQCSVILHLVV